MIPGWWVERVLSGPDGTVVLLSWVFWVIFSITLHELAHGWAAIRQGDDTPIRMGRMTMNPLVHMGGMSLLVFALIGIAWGAMPVDPSRFRWKRRGRIVVAGAGPAMNLVLAFISLTLGALWMRYAPAADPLHSNVAHFLFIGGMLNIVLAAFNLLPIPPLDGSNILMGLSHRWYAIYNQPQAQMIGFFIMLALLLSGMFGLLFQAASWISGEYFRALRSVLP
jgi:Zn-dependent protease